MTWYPGCGGCCEGQPQPSCINFTDDFDDGTIDPRWTQASGTWTEANGYLSTNSQNAVIYSSQGLTGPRGLRADVWGTEVEDEAILWLERISATQFTGVKITFGEFGLQFGKVSLIWHDGFSTNEVFCWTDHANRNEWVHAQGCLQLPFDLEPGYHSAKIVKPGGELLVELQHSQPIPTLFNPSCGLGSGSLSGQARFDNYEERITYQPNYLHCGKCDTGGSFCYYNNSTHPGYGGQALFINGSAAKEWGVDISGILAGTCPTNDCVDNVNALYLVPATSSFGLGPCGGELTLGGLTYCPGGLQTLTGLNVTVTTEPVGAYGCKIKVFLEERGGFSNLTIAEWEKIYADGVRVGDVTNVSMSLVASASGFCNGASAQCLLTAIP